MFYATLLEGVGKGFLQCKKLGIQNAKFIFFLCTRKVVIKRFTPHKKALELF
jgi:hypothetical protein